MAKVGLYQKGLVRLPWKFLHRPLALEAIEDLRLKGAEELVVEAPRC